MRQEEKVKLSKVASRMFTNDILRPKCEPLLHRYSIKDVQSPSGKVTAICNLHCLDILFECVRRKGLAEKKDREDHLRVTGFTLA